MARITLRDGTAYTVGSPSIVNADGRDVLVQLDWDYPGVASTFGWTMDLETFGTPAQRRCAHAGTDGTIRCPDCGAPAGAFISAARAWIAEHDGATADDPGYFREDAS